MVISPARTWRWPRLFLLFVSFPLSPVISLWLLSLVMSRFFFIRWLSITWSPHQLKYEDGRDLFSSLFHLDAPLVISLWLLALVMSKFFFIRWLSIIHWPFLALSSSFSWVYLYSERIDIYIIEGISTFLLNLTHFRTLFFSIDFKLVMSYSYTWATGLIDRMTFDSIEYNTLVKLASRGGNRALSRSCQLGQSWWIFLPRGRFGRQKETNRQVLIKERMRDPMRLSPADSSYSISLFAVYVPAENSCFRPWIKNYILALQHLQVVESSY